MASLLFLYICGMKVLICDNIEALGVDFIEKCKEILPEWRCQQMMRYKHLRGQLQCAVSYLMLQQALYEVIHCVRNEKWVYNEHGKPYFDGSNDLFFSISHCKNAVAAVVADEEVGIDIEEISRYKDNLMKYVLNEEESLELKGENLEMIAEKFIRIWTRKEAAFKCYGTGITHEIKDILKRGDIEIYSMKMGDKWLSVAAGCISENISVQIVSIDEVFDFMEKWRNFYKNQ